MKQRFFQKIILSLTLLCLPFLGLYADNPEGNTYETADRLFHIARSANKNLVCYDANMIHGKLDTHKPLKVYWVNREERPGETNGLSYIQRKLAYGYKLVSENTDKCICTLTAYPDRKLTITQQGDKCICTVTINNQQAILKSLYVKASPKNPLSVEYVELRGISLDTKEMVTEKVQKK